MSSEQCLFAGLSSSGLTGGSISWLVARAFLRDLTDKQLLTAALRGVKWIQVSGMEFVARSHMGNAVLKFVKKQLPVDPMDKGG